MDARHVVFILMWFFVTGAGGYYLGKFSARERLGKVESYTLLVLYMAATILVYNWLFGW